MIEDAFLEWYNQYNPDLDPDGDDALDELRNCFYTAWKRALDSESALSALSGLSQGFDK